jgi:hypothetical protein
VDARVAVAEALLLDGAIDEAEVTAVRPQRIG